jgi:hypothetical protein
MKYVDLTETEVRVLLASHAASIVHVPCLSKINALEAIARMFVPANQLPDDKSIEPIAEKSKPN